MPELHTRAKVNAVDKEPEPTGLTKAEVERIAARFAAKVGYEPAGDLDRIVKNLGGTIEYCDLATLNHTGSLDVRGPRDFSIYLPPYTGRLRDRFTIAHELGHYVLHSRIGAKAIRVDRAESNAVEWEANWFAAALLMPEDEFTAAFRSRASIPHLAARFDVSPAAAEVRVRALGLDQNPQTTPD